MSYNFPTSAWSGRYVVVSGGEGTGKTTLLTSLRQAYPDVVFTREPGATDVGQKIRSALLDGEVTPDPWSELFLFFADRADHIAKIVRPALASGKTVISDRAWMDTFAYQWWARMGKREAPAFMDLITTANFPVPDVWLWLDLDPAVGIARRKQTAKMDRLDKERLEFHQDVRAGFAAMAEILGNRTIRLDASQSIPQVEAAAMDALHAILPPIS